MLVLKRKHKESIVVGGVIEMTILRIDGNSVQVGIKAPQDVKILRKEIAKREASDKSVDAL